RSISRSGSMTRPTPRSVSATTKLVLPSSGAGIASTVYMGSAADRNRRQKDPDRDERDHDRTAVEDDLCGHALAGFETEVDEEIANAVREVKERRRDQDQQVELDDRIAEGIDPGVVVAVYHGHDVERTEDALDQDVDGNQDGRDDPALREQEPENQVVERGFGDSGVPTRPSATLPASGEVT